jgi:hypothetical protein
VPRWKSDPCWKPLRAIVSPFLGISMARPACSSSLFSVIRMSSCFAISPLALHPSHYFVRTETPILPKAISRQAIYRAFSGVPVHPRNRHLQKPGDLMHRQKLSVVFISLVHHCGPLLRNVALTKHSARSPRSWAGATPRTTLGTETCTKVGSLQPNPVFCPRPN